MVQDLPESEVATWQMLIQRHYRRWLGLAASAEASVLYRSREHFGLNLKNLRDMFHQLRVVRWHILKYSHDPQFRKLYIRRLERDCEGHIGKGRSGSACLELESLEQAASYQRIVGNAQTGRAGLGFVKSKPRPILSDKKANRRQLIDIMKKQTEQARIAVIHDYQIQSKWLNWDGVESAMNKDLSWNKILTQYSERLLKFVLNARLNTLPSPDNLRR